MCEKADSKCVYMGDFRNDARTEDYHNWIVGKFVKEQNPRNTELVEIKFWKFKKGEKTDHENKTSCTIECTLILSGLIKGTIDNEERKLCAGDYVVIAPGTPNDFPQEVLEDTEGLTIKAPSIPAAKHLLVSQESDELITKQKRCA